MDQFVPADWSGHMEMADAFTPSCGEGDGLVDLLWCRGHVAMHSQPSPPVREHEAAPWFQYPVVDDPLDKDLFSEVFGEMPADGGCRVTRSDTAGYSAPPRGSDAMPNHDASTTVTSSSMRPKPPGAASRSSVRRKQSNTSESPGEVMQDAEESDSATDAVTTRGPAQRTSTGKRRRAAQDHNLSERRRRDRINEKMRALQELVPHCNKTDKVSMLDEAIEYLKSLQLQVQMMWTTGSGMAPAPVMFPASGAHRYMRRMAGTRSRMPPFRTCVYGSLNGTKKLSHEPSS